MNFTEITLTILLMFLPGIVAVLLINLLTRSKIYDPKMFFLYSYLISIMSYTIVSLFIQQAFLTFLIKGKLVIQPKEIIFSTVISTIIALVIVYTINSKLIFNLAGRIKITNKYGNGDVWSTVFNDPQTTWITLRPSNCSQYFVGEVEHFSDDDKIRELVLVNVAIYNDETGEYLYNQDRIYFSFPLEMEVTIEIGNHSIDLTRRR